MSILVTGAAGFIGSQVSQVLLDQGEQVVGIDNLNDYYDISLKQARLDRLTPRDGFTFIKSDISDREQMAEVVNAHPDIERVVHLAAQPGVRYSLINPYVYTQCNVDGHLVLIEAARTLKNLKHFVYASSSSVYGANTKLPYSVSDRTDNPVSLYAATKKSMEMMSVAYSRMHNLPMTGLRFFTVYGPWGRPDMSPFIFISKIIAGEPIPVFNNGEMRRDFTYIDDIVAGVVACTAKAPIPDDTGLAHKIYNIGNNRSEKLMHYISVIEEAIGKKAEINFMPMQKGDVLETYADIEDTRRDFGFDPKTSIDQGIPKLVKWYRDYYDV